MCNTAILWKGRSSAQRYYALTGSCNFFSPSHFLFCPSDGKYFDFFMYSTPTPIPLWIYPFSMHSFYRYITKIDT